MERKTLKKIYPKTTKIGRKNLRPTLFRNKKNHCKTTMIDIKRKGVLYEKQTKIQTQKNGCLWLG